MTTMMTMIMTIMMMMRHYLEHVNWANQALPRGYSIGLTAMHSVAITDLEARQHYVKLMSFTTQPVVGLKLVRPDNGRLGNDVCR